MRRRTIFSSRQNQRPARSGAILVVAMICLILTSALLGTLLKVAVAQRGHGRQEARRLQAEWLAESALDRAARQVVQNDEYTGETWNVPAKDLDGLHPGQVVIKVTIPKAAESNAKQIEVVARYPAEGFQSVKHTKRLAVTLPEPMANAATESPPAQAAKPERSNP